jgi:UDP-glucose 4-epimerase
MSNILVTGGAGFIGTNLIKRLIDNKHHVVSLDNYSSGKKANHQEGCSYYETDLSKILKLEKKLLIETLENGEFDCIYHLGALARIQPSLISPAHHISNNFNSTLHILEYARLKNIQIVYAGSSSKHHGLYGSPYAWSKWGGEELCKLYSRVYGLSTTICRFYNVYGLYQLDSGEYATVIGIFEKQFRKGFPLTITGDGEQRRDFTHVDDIVDGLIACFGKDFKAEFFELGRGVNYSINEVAEMFGANYPKKYIPKRKGEYPFTLADYSKAEAMLDYKPTQNLKEYLTTIANA